MATTTTFSPSNLLSQLANSQSSGCLELNEGLVSWKIYLQQGNLQYIYCSAQLLDQLRYHLHYLGWKQTVDSLKNLPQSFLKLKDKSPEQNIYGKVIAWLLAEKHLNLSQGTTLIKNIVQDELQFCLWLERGTSTWQDGHHAPSWIPPQIKDAVNLNLIECLDQAQTRREKWQKCSPELTSIHQRPYFSPGWNIKSLPPSGSLNQKALMDLTQVLRGRTSIRQLSLLLKKDELIVAQFLSPYIDEKIIYLHHPQPPFDLLPNIPKDHQIDDFMLQTPTEELPKLDTKTWQIVCIDDSPIILNEIQRFLDQDIYKITAIDDPVQAVPMIFKIRPDLILLDITMPRINGYKLCGLLRSSGNCDHIPIIMVTGNTGFVDKARAKLAGATDYFTKPFTKEGLNQIIAKYL